MLCRSWNVRWESDVANPLCRNNLISEDGRVTAVILVVDHSEESIPEQPLQGFEGSDPGSKAGPSSFRADAGARFLIALDHVVARYQSPEFPILLRGIRVGLLAITKKRRNLSIWPV